jgi:hypothetical protein
MLCVAARRCAATSRKASEAPGGDGLAPILVPTARAVAAARPTGRDRQHEPCRLALNDRDVHAGHCKSADPTKRANPTR